MKVEKCSFEEKVASLPNDEHIFLPSIQQSLNTLIKNEGYITYKINKNLLSPNGENFLGVICKIDINGKTARGHKETNIIMKIITPCEQTTLLSLADVYVRELYVYKELSKIFTDVQNEFNVPEEERYQTVRCYNESKPNLIILENMTKMGFKTYLRSDFVSLEFARLGVRQLAKFHGLSFVLKIKRPTYFEKHIRNIRHPYIFDDNWNSFSASLSRITLNYLDDISKKKLEAFMLKFVEKYRLYLEDETTKLCLCHGDYRASNILMKECNGQISEVIPIDYQMIYYGCPALDFIYFIFGATDQAFRRAHIPFLKDVYHVTLTEFLKYFDINVDTVFSRNQFETMYDARLDYGLMTSLLLVPLLMASEGEVLDLTTESLAKVKYNSDEKCKERMVGIVDDFIEWGYL